MVWDRRAAAARSVLSVSSALAVFAGCGHRVLAPQLHEPDQVPKPDPHVPILKVHMKSGELYLLGTWHASADGRTVDGTGTRYSISRVAGTPGRVSIPVAEVALFETNRTEHVGAFPTGVLAVMTTVFGTLTAVCVADPKSCFGSCPTFYREDADPLGRPAAEGFSASIARVLEARDVDAIGAGPPAGGRFALTMRNEALETHAVRRVRLLAVERSAGGRVLAGPGDLYYPAHDLTAARSCRAAEGDCLEAVRAQDGVERFSAADASDLAARETLELDFAPANGRVGLVIGARQTLLSTHLFYQTLAYLGSRAGEYLASLERGGPAAAARAMGLARELGGIEAEVSESRGTLARDRKLRRAGADRRRRPGPAVRVERGAAARPPAAVEGPLAARPGGARAALRSRRATAARAGRGRARREAGHRRTGAAAARGASPGHGARRRLPHRLRAAGLAARTRALPRERGLLLRVDARGVARRGERRDGVARALRSAAGAAAPGGRPFKQHEADLERAFWASRFRR